jgi:BCD family chlorophyll transporter-like MFS transporter
VTGTGLSWGGVVRIGLVQAAIGSIVVLMTSTLNRIMVIELGLAAAVPGALVALHFAVQFLFRPRMGHQSDRGGRRTRTILVGMGLLSSGAVGAAAAIARIPADRTGGLIAATLAFALIGVGVSAAGTPLLAMLAERVAAERRGRAAAVVWLMMIAGFVLTTVIVGRLIDPFSFARLIGVTAGVGVVAFATAALALAGLERVPAMPRSLMATAGFREALRAAWAEPATRRFALFVFVAMLGYSAQDLILEPFAGAVFGLAPGASTRISSLHQGGMLAGMLVAAALAVRWGGLAIWAAGGCVASAAAFVLLAAAPGIGTLGMLRVSVFGLGVANGVFAIGAIGSMMVRARGDRAGLKMGIYGGAQAVAYAIGGFLGALGSDLARSASGSTAQGYVVVFVTEAVLFLGAAVLVGTSPRLAADRLRISADDEGERLIAVLN